MPFSRYPVVTANIDPFYQNETDSFQTNTFRPAMEAYMQDIAPDPNTSLNIWAAATSMAKCEVGNITCTNIYMDGTHAFDTTGANALCKGELDMAWRYFREMYINKKRKITNDFINTTTPVFPVPGKAHVLQFPDMDALMIPGGALSSNYNEGVASLNTFISDNCTASAVQWSHELAPRVRRKK